MPGLGLAQSFWEYPRSLWLQRPATGEEQKVVYWADGQYDVEGYRRACHMLRDVQANVTVAMDPVLLDILRGIQGWFDIHGLQKPLILTSGYRSPRTNATTEGAARNSQHVAGKAADIRIPDVPASYLGKLAQYFQGGGVGFYYAKNFVHVDTGRLRVWTG